MLSLKFGKGREADLQSAFAKEIIKLLLLRTVGTPSGLGPEFCLGGPLGGIRASMTQLRAPPPGCPADTQWYMRFQCAMLDCQCIMTVYGTPADLANAHVQFQGVHQHPTGMYNTLYSSFRTNHVVIHVFTS